MGKMPDALRRTIARNIRECRMRKFPGRGGGKKCAAAFGVSPQQWSPWERGARTPDESRLGQMAEFFGVTVEWLRKDHYGAVGPRAIDAGTPASPYLPHGPSMAQGAIMPNPALPHASPQTSTTPSPSIELVATYYFNRNSLFHEAPLPRFHPHYPVNDTTRFLIERFGRELKDICGPLVLHNCLFHVDIMSDAMNRQIGWG